MEDPNKNLVLALLAYSVQRDVLPERLCGLSKIDFEKLVVGTNDTLRQKQIDELWLNAVDLSGDNLFGLHFGESLQLSALGIVGEIIKSSNSVGDALSIAASLSHLVTNLFSIGIEQTKDTFTLEFIPQDNEWQSNPVALQILDLLMVFVIHEMDGLVLKKIKPSAVSYFRQEKDVAEFERIMRCKPVLASNKNSISFPMKYWNEPILTKNYELQNVLIERIHSVKIMSNKKPMFKDHVYNYLISNSYLGIASLNEIASNYNMSSRTFQRKLKGEGSSFQQLADKARKSLAINYLKSGSYPVKEISYLLGYNELSAFTRSFKRWTGLSPVFYQKKYENSNLTHTGVSGNN